MLKRHQIKRNTFAEQAVAKTKIPASGFKLVTVTRNESKWWKCDSYRTEMNPWNCQYAFGDRNGRNAIRVDVLERHRSPENSSLSLGVFHISSVFTSEGNQEIFQPCPAWCRATSLCRRKLDPRASLLLPWTSPHWPVAEVVKSSRQEVHQVTNEKKYITTNTLDYIYIRNDIYTIPTYYRITVLLFCLSLSGDLRWISCIICMHRCAVVPYTFLSQYFSGYKVRSASGRTSMFK